MNGLVQDASGDFYPEPPKDDTMTDDRPAWATDPRGLPPAVQTESGLIIQCHSGLYNFESPAEFEASSGPITPLWPDTPPTPIDPADIKVGMRVRRTWDQAGGPTLSVEGTVSHIANTYIDITGWDYLKDVGDWFLLEAAPDPDAHWIRAIAEATPDTAATVYAAIRGEQA